MKDPRMLKRMLDQAKKAQREMQLKLKEFDEQVFEETFGANHVSIEIRGDLTIEKISISDSLLADKEMLEEIITDAVNTVVQKIAGARKEIEESIMPKGGF